MSQRPKMRVAILISGRGSNMVALAKAFAEGNADVEIAVVASNDPSAQGLALAGELGIQTLSVDHRPFAKARQSHEEALDKELSAYNVDLICLAGYMRLLSPWFVRRWHNRMINIHPSLLPSFKGLDTHKRALEEGVRWHGCTVHFVREAMDEGPIIAQAAVPVMPGDTADTLGARVLSAEHQLYSHALRMLASGRVEIDGERIIDQSMHLPDIKIHPAVSN